MCDFVVFDCLSRFFFVSSELSYNMIVSSVLKSFDRFFGAWIVHGVDNFLIKACGCFFFWCERGNSKELILVFLLIVCFMIDTSFCMFRFFNIYGLKS